MAGTVSQGSSELFQTQRDPPPFGIVLEHLHPDFLAHLDYFGGVSNSSPGKVGDVKKPADSAEIDKDAVVGEILDPAEKFCAFHQSFSQFSLASIYLFLN